MVWVMIEAFCNFAVDEAIWEQWYYKKKVYYAFPIQLFVCCRSQRNYLLYFSSFIRSKSSSDFLIWAINASGIPHDL